MTQRSSRADPALLPAAGKPRRQSVGSPLKLTHSSSMDLTGTGLQSSQKQFHRRKHQPPPDMHLATLGGRNNHSSPLCFDTTTQSIHTKLAPVKRFSRFDWSRPTTVGAVGGLGYSLPTLEGNSTTKDWRSTTSATMHGSLSRTDLSDRVATQKAARYSAQPWSSTAQSTFTSSDALTDTCRNFYVTRRAELEQRAVRKEPLQLS